MLKFNKQTTACFTGYRQQKLLKQNAPLKEILLNLDTVVEKLYDKGYRTFMCGMCSGFDLLAANAVINLKNRHQDILLIAVVPFEGQQRDFTTTNDQSTYSSTLLMADHVEIISQKRSPSAYLKRNDFMLSNSSTLVAYYNPEDRSPRSGTLYTVRHAKKQDLSIVNLCTHTSST